MIKKQSLFFQYREGFSSWKITFDDETQLSFIYWNTNEILKLALKSHINERDKAAKYLTYELFFWFIIRLFLSNQQLPSNWCDVIQMRIRMNSCYVHIVFDHFHKINTFYNSFKLSLSLNWGHQNYACFQYPVWSFCKVLEFTSLACGCLQSLRPIRILVAKIVCFTIVSFK